ncbi:hypothetical protein MNEG_11977, partial [Monoraphidium neglectum]
GRPHVEEISQDDHLHDHFPRHHPAFVEEPDDEEPNLTHEQREPRPGAGHHHYPRQPHQQQQHHHQQQQGYPHAGPHHYQQQQQQQHQGPPPFGGAPFSGFAPFGGHPFGGGLFGGGGMGMGGPFGGMGMGMGAGFGGLFGSMFAQMDNMMREMGGALRSTGAAAASGALPPGAVYMGQSSTYNSDGTRVTTSTRASGGVRETQTIVDDRAGQRTTIARGIGDRERITTRKRDAHGHLQTQEELRGGVQDPQAFEAEWRRAAEQRLPRGGQQQQQQGPQRIAVTSGGGHGHAQIQGGGGGGGGGGYQQQHQWGQAGGRQGWGQQQWWG